MQYNLLRVDYGLIARTLQFGNVGKKPMGQGGERREVPSHSNDHNGLTTLPKCNPVAR